MEKKTDKELLILANNGNKEAVEELCSRYKKTVRGIARNYFLPSGETEDLIQEGMIGLYNAICGYDATKGFAFSTFAHTCIERKIISAIQKYEGRNNEYKNWVSIFSNGFDYSVDTDPDYELIIEEEKKEFRDRIVKVLSDFEYRIVDYYLKGYTIGEIAEAVGKSTKSCENAISRSKKKIKACFKD